MEFSTIAKLVAVLENCDWTDEYVLGFVDIFESLEPEETQVFYVSVAMLKCDDEYKPICELRIVSVPLNNTLRAKLGPELYNALRRHGITDLVELCRLTEREVRKIRMIGPKRLVQLREYMASFGLSFAD